MDDSQTYYFLWACTRRGISILLRTNMDVKKLPVIGEHDFIRKGY